MPRFALISGLSVIAALSNARADLNTLGVFTGNVGLSIDAIGSGENPVGLIQAQIPTDATIKAAYLYSAGTPYPYYPNAQPPASPTSLADYNTSPITVAGMPITFTDLVGAVSSRPDIGQWFTARADVTSLINSLRVSGKSDYQWPVTEGTLNNRIDGEVLAIVYESPSLPKGNVVLLDGGQNTGGETKQITFTSPLSDTSAPGFIADMSLGISFSGDSPDQRSIVNVNGSRLTSSAGGYDDGIPADGGLITAGGIGDSNANPPPFSTDTSLDDELYSLKTFLNTGDTGMTIFTQNPSNDDNIFFLGLRISADVGDVIEVPAPDGGSTLPLLGVGMASLALISRRKA